MIDKDKFLALLDVHLPRESRKDPDEFYLTARSAFQNGIALRIYEVAAAMGKVFEKHHTQETFDAIKALLDEQKICVADMFWDDADPEHSRSSIHEVIDCKWCDGLVNVGDEVEIQQAIRLPNIKVRLIDDPEDEDGFDYEEIKP